MTASFIVCTTPKVDRLAKKLARRHREFPDRLAEAIQILQVDPYNRSHAHPVKKLEGIRAGEGQYRLRLGRWRFRYDIVGNDVVLEYCGLRREDTYR